MYKDLFYLFFVTISVSLGVSPSTLADVLSRVISHCYTCCRVRYLSTVNLTSLLILADQSAAVFRLQCKLNTSAAAAANFA